MQDLFANLFNIDELDINFDTGKIQHQVDEKITALKDRTQEIAEKAGGKGASGEHPAPRVRDAEGRFRRRRQDEAASLHRRAVQPGPVGGRSAHRRPAHLCGGNQQVDVAISN